MRRRIREAPRQPIDVLAGGIRRAIVAEIVDERARPTMGIVRLPTSAAAKVVVVVRA